MSASLQLLDHLPSEGGPSFHGMIGTHPSMLRLFGAIKRAAPLDAPIIIQGPTGSGKELVAHALHALSGRRGPVVPVNVGTIPEQLADSELFGSVRGAFTGSVAERIGLIESARGGTLFLDEAAELSVATQIRLLRVLESGVVRPVGSAAGRHVNFRLVLCLQQSAAELVATKRWREDFYYRVAGVSLAIPALSERATDIGALANYFLNRIGHPPLGPAVADRLAERPWPGNVRELWRVIERAVFLVGQGPLTIEVIDEAAESLSPRHQPWAPIPAQSLAAMEREHIERVLRESGYRTRIAAKLLGVSVGQLYRKYRALGIEPPRAR